MKESIEKIENWESELVQKKVELEECKTDKEKEAKQIEIEKVRNQKSALQSRVNRKLESSIQQANVDKLTNLLNKVIFDDFDPELSDAQRQRIQNRLQAKLQSDSEIPVANTPKQTRGRKAKATSETLNKVLANLIDKAIK